MGLTRPTPHKDAAEGKANFMRNIVGKPVSGADFLGREGELQSLIEAVRDQHVLLLAPRRVGKTSLLFALASHFQTSKEMHATYVSVAAAQDEAELIRLVFQAIYDTPAGKRLRPNLMARWLSRRRQRIKKLGAAGASIELEPIERPWQPAADEAFARLRASQRPTLESALAKHLVEPTARKETLRWLLDALGHDGYLVAEQGRWRFRSGLLRRYWQRNCA